VHGPGALSGPGLPTVTFNSLIAMRATDIAACAGPPNFIVTGSQTVTIGGRPVARMTDKTLHGGMVSAGSGNVFVGGPTVGATLGDPARAAQFFPGQQANKDTCALMTTQGIVHQATGTQHTEPQMQAIGIASGAYTVCNGTTNESAVMNQAGIPATTVGSPTLQDMAQALGEGRAVIVGLDARHIWNQPSPSPLGHAIRVTGVEFDANGQPTAVFINDTGSGMSNQRVPAADFNNALSGFGGGRMTTSNNPVP
jgi:uncharacterized Zn-binding protein involved in type VI secretion